MKKFCLSGQTPHDIWSHAEGLGKQLKKTGSSIRLQNEVIAAILEGSIERIEVHRKINRVVLFTLMILEY